MSAGSIALISVFSINIFLLLIMIFVERKQPQVIFSWFVVLTVLPVFGFVLYILFGGGLSLRTRLLIRRKKRYTKDYYRYLKWQKVDFENLKQKNQQFNYAYDLIKFVKSCDENLFSTSNKVENRFIKCKKHNKYRILYFCK